MEDSFDPSRFFKNHRFGQWFVNTLKKKKLLEAWVRIASLRETDAKVRSVVFIRIHLDSFVLVVAFVARTPSQQTVQWKMGDLQLLATDFSLQADVVPKPSSRMLMTPNLALLSTCILWFALTKWILRTGQVGVSTGFPFIDTHGSWSWLVARLVRS